MMSLIDFARGPALDAAFAVFLFGLLYRLVALFFLPRMTDRTVARRRTPPAVFTAVMGFLRHQWPPRPFVNGSLFGVLNGYIFHIGLAVVVFGLAQHILFIRNLVGFSWPGLPTGVVTVAAIITLGSLFAALFRRMFSPVMRTISTANDYLTWLFTTLPVITGIWAVSHLWLPYETLLAIHILSVAALLIWFPFGKLMHAFIVFLSRSESAVFYRRRGVKI